MMAFDVRYVAAVDPALVTHRLIRNPNYGGKPTPIPGACVILIRERKIKPMFFVELKANVELHGFRNPILLYNCPEHGLLLAFGGSRLRVAKEIDKALPCIIVDYAGDYDGYDLVAPYNWREFFHDVPELFEFTETGVDTHYSLERGRREHYDPAGMAWVDDHPGCTEFLHKEFPWLLT